MESPEPLTRALTRISALLSRYGVAVGVHCPGSTDNWQGRSFIMGAEDGTVWQYDTASGKMQSLLVRCALPVRDIALTKDGEWVAVASE